MVTCVLWTVGFIPRSSPDCCSASTGSAAAAPGQGSQENTKKTSSHKEKVCREDLDGETGPRDISKLESEKETADFLVGKNRSSPLWMVFQLLNQGVQDGLLFLNPLALILGFGRCVCTYSLVWIHTASWGPGEVRHFFPKECRDEDALARAANQEAGR